MRLARSPSHSKPCLGAGVAAGALLASVLRAPLPREVRARVEPLARGARLWPPARALVVARAGAWPLELAGALVAAAGSGADDLEARAAARRGLERWGRVRGSLARTLAASGARSDCCSLSSGPLIGT